MKMITNHTDAELAEFMQKTLERKTVTDEPEEFEVPDFGANEEGLIEMAKMGLTVFRAVLRDGGTHNEAFAITAAFFAGIGKATLED